MPTYLEKLKADPVFNRVFEHGSFLIEINEKISRHMSDKRVNYMSMAKKLGVTRGVFKEKLRTEFTLSELFLIAHELDVSVKDLL